VARAFVLISIRDQQLTGMNPCPTPTAGRAGVVKKYDRITKINNEVALNMGLNEAGEPLRGAPGRRSSMDSPRPDRRGGRRQGLRVMREVIHVAVEHS